MYCWHCLYSTGSYWQWFDMLSEAGCQENPPPIASSRTTQLQTRIPTPQRQNKGRTKYYYEVRIIKGRVPNAKHCVPCFRNIESHRPSMYHLHIPMPETILKFQNKSLTSLILGPMKSGRGAGSYALPTYLLQL